MPISDPGQLATRRERQRIEAIESIEQLLRTPNEILREIDPEMIGMLKWKVEI